MRAIQIHLVTSVATPNWRYYRRNGGWRQGKIEEMGHS